MLNWKPVELTMNNEQVLYSSAANAAHNVDVFLILVGDTFQVSKIQIEKESLEIHAIHNKE